MAAKIFHIILAFAVLCSTTGVVMGKHFCKKQMLATEAAANYKTTCSEADGGCGKDCCSHEYEYVQSDQDKLAQTFDLPTLHKPVLLATLFLVFELEIPSIDNNTLQFQTYRPPIVERDILALFETFLI